MLVGTLLGLGFLQMIVIIAITRRYPDIFNGRPAVAYGRAVSELVKRNPLVGNAVRLMYAAYLVELLVMFLAHR